MSIKPSYKDLAKYYDQFYSVIDYKREANLIKSIIKKHKKAAGKDLLEVACGTGKHISYLKDSFSITATDISKEMLAVARKRTPDVKFQQADMIKLNLKKKFDVLMCMFGSIGYIKDYKNLDKVFANFARHLNKGGVVIIEPWFTDEAYTSLFMTGLPAMMTYEGSDATMARLCTCKKRGMYSVMDVHHLIAEKNKKLDYVIEHHELTMFKVEKMLELMQKNGIKAKFMKKGLLKGMGLYIGVKQ